MVAGKKQQSEVMSPNFLTYLSEGQSRELNFERMLSCFFNWNTSTVYVSTPVSQQADEQPEEPILDPLFFIVDCSKTGVSSKTLLKFTWKR